MREFTVAIVLSVLVLGGALLLPYSLRPSLPVQTVAVQKQVEAPKAPQPFPAEPARPTAMRKQRKPPLAQATWSRAAKSIGNAKFAILLSRERTVLGPRCPASSAKRPRVFRTTFIRRLSADRD